MSAKRNIPTLVFISAEILKVTDVTHLGIACLSLILGRELRRVDYRIHQGALVHQQTTLAQYRIDDR